MTIVDWSSSAMTSDVNEKSSSKGEQPIAHETSSSTAKWLSIPQPIKRAFNRFPLKTYPTNRLPRRSAAKNYKNILYVFTSQIEALHGAPSHNPACLKWQAYLKFAGVEFATTPSNNHASPTGSLPFLLPAASNESRPGIPVTSAKLVKWTSLQTGKEEELGIRYEAYASLLDHRIRSAWLYHLYLDELNFEHVAFPFYIASASSNMFVQMALGHQLQQAAKEELAKYTNTIDGAEILEAAEKAFEALSALLGSDEHFSGHAQPGLFDASVFAYTHLLLSSRMQWEQTALTNILRKYNNLVDHQGKLQNQYFSH